AAVADAWNVEPAAADRAATASVAAARRAAARRSEAESGWTGRNAAKRRGPAERRGAQALDGAASAGPIANRCQGRRVADCSPRRCGAGGERREQPRRSYRYAGWESRARLQY